MKLHLHLGCLAYVVLSFFPLPGLAHPQAAAEIKTWPSGSTTSYPNSSDGLCQLLKDRLQVTKKGDQAELLSMIRETEIPNYKSWFITALSQENGERWARRVSGKTR